MRSQTEIKVHEDMLPAENKTKEHTKTKIGGVEEMAKNTGCSSRGLMVNPSTHMSNYSSMGSDVLLWSPKSTRYRSGI